MAKPYASIGGNNRMEYRRLGRTGLKVSPLCLGCWRFGSDADEGSALGVISAALEAGINFIDTADVYTGGQSERIVGKALAGRRSEVVLATKFRWRSGKGPNAEGASRKHILEACDASLRRLGTDYIDLYQIHGWDGATPIEETMRALDDLVRGGKVRYIGCSNFSALHLCRALWAAERCGGARFDSVQPHYNLLDRGAENELLPFCQEMGIGCINYSPLAGGLLTGKYRRGEAVPAGTRASREEGLRRRLDDRMFDRLERLEGYAAEQGHTLAHLALAYLLAQPFVSAPIIGANSVAQLQESLGALEWPLGAEAAAKVRELAG